VEIGKLHISHEVLESASNSKFKYQTSEFSVDDGVGVDLELVCTTVQGYWQTEASA
jgi:hypothetical protein